MTPNRSFSPVIKSRLRMSLVPRSQEKLRFPSRIALLVAAGTTKCSNAESNCFRKVVVPATTPETVSVLLVPTATRAMCSVERGRNPSPHSLTGMDKNMLFRNMLPVVGRCRKRSTVHLIAPSTLYKIQKFSRCPGDSQSVFQ
ncbi:hypothetical protein T07_1214 [Trichinella nelsoni]|uniref:Uncharacterized protein n=1 Tax=Trichinella nelsoni TaxID=6336 RepID=A0A0V0SJL2_9BILA|nr:hypothetical protein T07_1214 [Trichinella nelsoni]